MSIKVMTHVWEHSKERGSRLLMLLAIADHADDHGIAYPGIERLARKTRMSERNAQMTLRALEQAGELFIEMGKGIETGHGCTNRYNLKQYQDSIGYQREAVNFTSYDYGVKPTSPQEVKPVSPLGVKPTSPKPSVEPLVETSVKEFAPQSVAPEPPTNIIPFQSNEELPDPSAEVSSPTLVPPAALRPVTDWQAMVGLCMDIWKCKGGKASKIAQMLTGKARGETVWAQSKPDRPVDIPELKGWHHWITQSRREMPQAAWQIQESLDTFRASTAYEDAIRDANAPPAPPPEPEPEVTPEQVAAARARRDAAVQEFLTRHRIGGKEAIRGKQSKPAA